MSNCVLLQIELKFNFYINVIQNVFIEIDIFIKYF